jgi:hypothetical protein
VSKFEKIEAAKGRTGDSRVDEMVDRRVADALSAAGWDGDRIATELMLLVPAAFRSAYTRMFHQALKGDAGMDAGARRAEEEARLGRSRGERTKDSQIALGSGGGKKFKKHWVVKDPKALELKSRIDRRLRSMARDIEFSLDGGELDDSRQCSGCGQKVSAGWRFCASCGHNLAEEQT